MRKDSRGTILVEFVGSFLLFVLLIMSVLSLVNIVTVQARVHYALTQTANTLSVYSYLLYITGLDIPLISIADGEAKVRSEANASIAEINDVLSEINNFSPSGVSKSTGTVGDRFESWADNIEDNSVGAIQLIGKYALSEISSAVFGTLLEQLVEYYLANGDMNGEEYLRSVRINSPLRFHSLSGPGVTPPAAGELVGTLSALPADDSVLYNEHGDIKITVQYDVDYSFMGMQLPWPGDPPKLIITQSVMTKMWRGGSGEGYIWSAK